MPRRRKSKNNTSNANSNKRRRSSNGSNSSNSPSKPSKKRSRVNSTPDEDTSPITESLFVDEETRGSRIEQYEEEGMDVDVDDSNRVESEDDEDQDENKEVDENEVPPKKSKYGNMEIASMEEIDERELRIYLDGCFDLTHFGHFRLFKQVKDKFPNSHIVVGVAGDEDTCRLKGQTVFNEDERSETISHCKWVDEVICPCPWIISQEFLDANNLDYVAHDAAPYDSAGEDDIYKFVKDQGRFIATQRTEGVSTTGLINRIVRRYNEYILRNLQRGVPREDLNISWTRVQRIKAQNALRSNAQYMAENFKKFTEEPDEFISGFLDMFGPGGRIRNKINEKIVEMREEFVEYAQFAPM